MFYFFIAKNSIHAVIPSSANYVTCVKYYWCSDAILWYMMIDDDTWWYIMIYYVTCVKYYWCYVEPTLLIIINILLASTEMSEVQRDALQFGFSPSTVWPGYSYVFDEQRIVEPQIPKSTSHLYLSLWG